MENTLNFVFDDWKEGEDEPKPNSEYYFNGCGRLDSIMNIFGYFNYKKYRIDDVSKYPDKNFYYIISDSWLVKPIIQDNILPINENVIEQFKKNNNLFFLSINEQEVEEIMILYKLDFFIKSLKLDGNNFYIVDNNYKITDIKEHLNLCFNTHTSHILSLLVQEVNEEHNINVNFIPNKKNASLFLCQNNKPREHRISLLILLSKYDIIEDVDWSLINGTPNEKVDEADIFKILMLLKNEKIFFSDEINTFYLGCDKFNDVNNIHNNIFNKNGDLEWKESTIKEPYENSYVNITTETIFFYRNVHITEKSFKPFAYYQFPLFLASHHHVKYLRENYNFDLFDDIIDHSYDNVVDNSDRLFKFVEEVKRIQDNKDFFIKFYEENKDRFLENYKKYTNLNNQHDVDFFNSLI